MNQQARDLVIAALCLAIMFSVAVILFRVLV